MSVSFLRGRGTSDESSGDLPSRRSISKEVAYPGNKGGGRSTAATNPAPIELFCSDRRFRHRPSARKKKRILRWEEIRPEIRLAHRRNETLNFGPRIIFDYQIFYVIAGGTRWTMRNREVECGPGQLVFLPPYEVHSSASGEDRHCDHIAIHFAWGACPSPAAGGTGNVHSHEIVLPGDVSIPPFQILKSRDGLAAKWNRIVELRKAGDPVSLLQADAVLMEALADLLRLAQDGKEAGPSKRISYMDRVRVEAVIAWMKDALDRPIEVRALAEVSGLSPCRFAHVFRDIVGRSPIEFLTGLRIERAKLLLGDHRLSVKEVAVLCGFEDPNHFSKVFSRVDGASPTQFRERQLRST